MVKLIRRTVLRVAEPKHTITNVAKVELYHNTFSYSLHLNDSAAMPTQGTGDNMRVGDQIQVNGFKIRALFGQKADRPNVNFRWFVIEAPKGLGASYANFFQNVTSNVLLDEVNTDAVKVIRSGGMRPNQAGLTATGDDEFTFAKKWYIPYKRLYKFGPAAATTAHNQPEVYLIVFAYDAYGSLITDNIAYISAVKEVFYKDP